MNILVRSLVMMPVFFLGITGEVVIFGAQPPQQHKREIEDKKEASAPKRPRIEEEKTDADHEEKEDREYYRSHQGANEQVSETDDEENISDAVVALQAPVKEYVVARYIKMPYAYDSKDIVPKFVAEYIAQRHIISLTPAEKTYLINLSDEFLCSHIHAILGDYFELFCLGNIVLPQEATPGEIANAFDTLNCDSNNFNGQRVIDVIQESRLHVQGDARDVRTAQILQNLKALNLSDVHCFYISLVFPYYAKLFTWDQAHEQPQRNEQQEILFNAEVLKTLVQRDVVLINEFLNGYHQRENKGRQILDMEAHKKGIFQQHLNLCRQYGDLRYRLYKFTRDLVFQADAASAQSLFKVYSDVIKNYASPQPQDNDVANHHIVALRSGHGLRNMSNELASKQFDCLVIGSFCYQLMQSYETYFGTDETQSLIQSFVRQAMDFEIEYADETNNSMELIIKEINKLKQIILSTVSAIKINTFKAFSKSVLSLNRRIGGSIIEWIVNRDNISSAEALLRNINTRNSIHGQLLHYHANRNFAYPVTVSFAADGNDHAGINRTMNTLLSRSFLGEHCFTSNEKFVLPKPIPEIHIPHDQGVDAFSLNTHFNAIGIWLSMIFINNISVPLPLPEVFYAIIKHKLPVMHDHASILLWAEYLKAYTPDMFERYYRKLFRRLLYGNVEDVKKYLRDIVGWQDSAVAELTEENKYQKVSKEVLFPLLNLTDYPESYAAIKNGALLFEERDGDASDINFFNFCLTQLTPNNVIAENNLSSWIGLLFAPLKKQSLLRFLRWLSPYDLEHFFPSSIGADELLHSLVFNRNDLGDDQTLLHVAAVFEQALLEYIQENRDNQEKLQKLVNYFTGSPVYIGQPLTVFFTVNQTYVERVATCFSQVDFSLRVVDTSNHILTDHVRDCQAVGDESFKATMKLVIASWDGQGLFSHEHPQHQGVPQEQAQ
ncbi:MAG: hypothetical protein WCW33_06145 [Candidatus Babeliales bacterium]|jgi:hypothetical protein